MSAPTSEPYPSGCSGYPVTLRQAAAWIELTTHTGQVINGVGSIDLMDIVRPEGIRIEVYVGKGKRRFYVFPRHTLKSAVLLMVHQKRGCGRLSRHRFDRQASSQSRVPLVQPRPGE